MSRGSWWLKGRLLVEGWLACKGVEVAKMVDYGCPIGGDGKWDSIINAGCGFVLGNEEFINFWTDEWIEGGSLKSCFPRIYALAIKKQMKVNEFGNWVNNCWVRVILLRRRVFDWELAQWHDFNRVLEGYSLNLKVNDSLIWTHSSNGLYSAKLLCNMAMEGLHAESSLWKSVWAALALPKVEAFSWLVVRERVAVKEFLASKGIIEWNATLCVLCGSAVEIVAYLFFHCNLVCLVKFRTASWVLAKWPHMVESFDIIFMCPNLASIPQSKQSTRVASCWQPPPFGFLKFNVDGSAMEKPGPTGIGGVLRNSVGDFLLLFSKSIGYVDSNVAEFLAIMEALAIFANSKWSSDAGLIVESDSLIAIKWFNGEVILPW
ncbi:hypothetical protein REPUB_Repub19eG0073200 [Reevesia pubescens]